MFGISAAYIKASEGVTDPVQRKLIRYCVSDVWFTQSVYNRFYRKGFKCL